MSITVPYSYPAPVPNGDGRASPDVPALLARYEEIAWSEDIRWDTRYQKKKLLGAGGQGAVYLAERLGADGFARPVALKVFSPEPYQNTQLYLDDMARVGQVSARVALIQCDNVVDI